jgi:hypothetical protein
MVFFLKKYAGKSGHFLSKIQAKQSVENKSLAIAVQERPTKLSYDSSFCCFCFWKLEGVGGCDCNYVLVYVRLYTSNESIQKKANPFKKKVSTRQVLYPSLIQFFFGDFIAILAPCRWSHPVGYFTYLAKKTSPHSPAIHPACRDRVKF